MEASMFYSRTTEGGEALPRQQWRNWPAAKASAGPCSEGHSETEGAAVPGC